jgi:hypothetical protein
LQAGWSLTLLSLPVGRPTDTFHGILEEGARRGCSCGALREFLDGVLENYRPSWLLHHASTPGTALWLRSRGVEIDPQTFTTLHLAARGNHAMVAWWAVELGDWDLDGIDEMAFRGNVKGLMYVRARGAPFPVGTIFVAASNGMTEAVEYMMLAEGAGTCQRRHDKLAREISRMAGRTGCREAARCLLDIGAWMPRAAALAALETDRPEVLDTVWEQQAVPLDLAVSAASKGGVRCLEHLRARGWAHWRGVVDSAARFAAARPCFQDAHAWALANIEFDAEHVLRVLQQAGACREAMEVLLHNLPAGAPDSLRRRVALAVDLAAARGAP